MNDIVYLLVIIQLILVSILPQKSKAQNQTNKYEAQKQTYRHIDTKYNKVLSH
jgi:hypothetical protein